MALFGTTRSFVGVDIGTSALKVVEVINKSQRLELSTYASADMANILINAQVKPEEAIKKTTDVLKAMLDKAQVSSDVAVAALPSGIVFSTVLMMPPIPDKDMNEAVAFAARDVVPADLDEMVLGWSRVGESPRMGSGKKDVAAKKVKVEDENEAALELPEDSEPKPVFVTAAPKNIVSRYSQVMEAAGLELKALEVETFPLTRALLNTPKDSAMFVDLGDQVSTFHLIEGGMPRVSQTIDYGGSDVTAAIATDLSISKEEAEKRKRTLGLKTGAPAEVRQATARGMKKVFSQAKQLLNIYKQQNRKAITKTFLIGGGANLPGLPQAWSRVVTPEAVIGDPWKGMSYPDKLSDKLDFIRPQFAVAAGLAVRFVDKV